MDQNDVVLRAIGILTHVTDLRSRMEQGEDPDVSDAPFETLMADVLHSELELPGDASPQEVADAVKAALDPAITQLAAAFSQIFQELADVHDAGRTDVSSSEVLKQLALRLSS